MKIKLSSSFREKLSNQVQFISKDKPEAARNFKEQLLSEIRNISAFPNAYRKSIFFNNEQIRDLIYKGYIITFRSKLRKE